MMRSKLAVLAAVYFGLAAVLTAQTPESRFDGTWISNPKESSSPNVFALDLNATWVIRSEGNKVTINADKYLFTSSPVTSTLLDDFSLTLFSDGSGETHRVGGVNISSKTKETKGALVREYNVRLKLAPPSRESELFTEVKEKYSLSKDGKKLIFEVTTRSSLPSSGANPNVPRPGRWVFDRKE